MSVGLLACSGERKATPGVTPEANRDASQEANQQAKDEARDEGKTAVAREEAPVAAARDAAAEVSAGVQPAPGPLVQEPLDVESFERPPETGQDGVVAAGVRFSDRNGANVVVLVHQVEAGGSVNNRRLWAHHYVEADGKRRILRTVRDQEENCEFDNLAGFVDGSLGVTDLDGDQLGEVAFAYDLGCMSDVSPKGRKVVLLENGEKWILRGDSRVDAGGGQRLGGRFTPDPAQGKWPKTLHDHAIDVWNRFVDR